MEIGYANETLEWKLDMIPEPWNENWLCKWNPGIEIGYNLEPWNRSWI